MTSTIDSKIEGARLHGVSLSPFVRKVRVVCAIKSIDYELVHVMPGAADRAFRAISPLSKVPVWEEDGWSLPDSSVICDYLERRVPEPSVHPTDLRALARDLFWEEYADTRLVETGGPIFFQRVVRARVFKEAPDEGAVRRQIEDVLPPVLDQVEKLYVESGEADPAKLTLGAISIWSTFVNLEHADHAIDATRWPGLAGFMEAMGRHAALAALVDEERAALRSF